MKSISSPIRSLSGLLAGLLLSLSSPTSRAADSPLDSTDKSFVTDTYADGLAEISMAEMAQTKTANADVKAFAAKIIADHTKANADLKGIADAKNVAVATSPSMTAQAKGKLLDVRSGDSFDKAYAADMVSDHKKDIEAFEKEANNAQDPDVKAFATKVLPTLKEHLSMAEELQQKLGK
jgi:putative membrane protein